MRLRDTVQSKWFKVDDLPGREQGWLDVTIRDARQGQFEDGRETVDLHFHEHPKPLGANATNRKRLLLMFGEDIELEDLRGKRVRLYAEMTQDAKGAPCWGVRIKPIPDTVQAASAAARERISAATVRQSAPTMRQDKPDAFVRPMSHDPRPFDPGSTVPPVRANPARPTAARVYQDPQEPAGFIDQADPGPDDPFAAGGRW